MRVIKVKSLFFRSCFAIVASAACTAPTMAEVNTAGADIVQPTSEPQVFSDWRVACDDEQPCRMSQTIVQPTTARAILQVKLFKGDDPTALVTFPLGILLSPGWRYRIDDGPETVLPFEICDGDGCHAGVKLTPDLLTAMKRGNQMNIVFFDAARSPVEPAISLTGFSKAWEVLE